MKNLLIKFKDFIKDWISNNEASDFIGVMTSSYYLMIGFIIAVMAGSGYAFFVLGTPALLWWLFIFFKFRAGQK